MPKEISELRRRAEEKNAQSPENIDALFPEETQHVLHELRVHQIELEMQNEELRTSHAELEAARARYSDLYEMAPVGYCTISEKGLILEANLTASVMMDLPRGSLVTQHFGRFIFKEDYDIYYMYMKRLFEAEEMQAFELRMLKKDGSIFWARLDATVTKADGAATVIRVVISDISKRKKAEKELLASEDLAFKIMHLVPANIAVIDREGQIIAVNRAWTEFSKRNRSVEALDDAVGSNYLDVCRQSVADKDADALLALVGIEAVLAGVRDQFTHEYPCHSLKEQHWFLMTVVPLGVGGIGGAVIFHSDITERKLEEEKIKRTNARLSLATQAGGVGIWDFDPVNNKLIWDEQMFRLYGTASDKFSGAYEVWQAGLHPDDRQRSDDEIRLALSGEKEFNTEFRVLWPDGAVRNIRAQAIVQRNPAGQRLHMIGTNWDITVQKQAEAILKRDKKALKILVREKSVELMENQLELERAKRLSDIGTLAATVAHELRNPLSGISLAAAVIKRKNADNMVERQLQRIDIMVAESGQIIDNLLFYSRLKPKHRKTLEVHSLLEECIDILQQVHIGQNIVISKHIAALKNVTICADPGQIREVFANILNNAADAVPEHGGEIDVKARIYHGLIKIHITDNGIGIAKKDMKKVFDPFFTTKAKGTGLGLTVCMQIVKMHGGFINIKSGNEKGTSCIITLPLGEPKK